MPEKPKKNTQEKSAVSPVGEVTKVSTIPTWAPLAVILFTALLYIPALQNGFTDFDDNFYVTRNPLLADFSLHGVKVIFTSFYYSNYHPLTIFTYLLEYKWFGLNPMPYHLVNVLLHLFNTWLVFKLAEQLSSNKTVAVIVCALFAIHPMHVESVAWISELKDMLYTCFFLLSTIYYLHYTGNGRPTRQYLAAIAFFILSLLSKSAAVTLPVLLIAIDVYKGRRIGMKLLTDKIPFLLLSVTFGIVNIISFKSAGTLNESVVSYGFINRIFLFTYAVQSYVLRVVVPFSLSAMHHYPPVKDGMLPWQYYASFPIVLIISWLTLKAVQLRKETWFGASFFLIAISVMLQIISFSSHLFAERYTYVAYIGLFYIAAQWITKIGLVKWKNATLAVCAVFAIAYAGQSWARIGTWKDSMTLFNDMVEKEPDVYFGYYMRGNAEKSAGDLQAAMTDYNTAINLNPNFEDIFYNRAILHNALGNAKAAIQDYSNSIRLNPKLPDAYNNRGWAYFQLGDTAAALKDIDQAIMLKPEYAEAYNNRGWICSQSGKTKEALQNYDKAIAVNPSYSRPRYNRAALMGTTGNYPAALEDYNYLVSSFPDDNNAYFYRGVTRLMMKDTAAACTDFRNAQARGNETAAQMINQYCR